MKLSPVEKKSFLNFLTGGFFYHNDYKTILYKKDFLY